MAIMASSSEMQVSSEVIGHALRDRMLAVPRYQRPYAWEKAHVTDFLHDIQDALDKGEPEYFIGSIVCTNREATRSEIIDGQQRLATTTILIASIRDYFHSEGDSDRATTIAGRFLQEKDLKTQEINPRLRLSDSDNSYFRKRVLSEPDSDDRNVVAEKGSHRRIDQAARLARAHVVNLTKVTSDPTGKLTDLIEFLDKGVKVIWIEAPDDANAFVIFETLNDRGLDLAIADLLKNYLFLLAEERISEVQARWIEMYGVIEAVADDAAIKDFIRHLWSSQHGTTRERDLYIAMKKGVTSKQAAVDFAEHLARGSKLYAALLNTDNQLWTQLGATARGHASTINTLGMIQIRPLLLAVLTKFPPKEIKKTLKSVVSWGVRFLIHGGLGGGFLENHYCIAAQKVWAKELKSEAALRAQLFSVIPTDEEFSGSFKTARVSKTQLARYYLRAMESQNEGEPNPELVPNPNSDEVNLEHVLPLNPSTDWSNFDAEDAKAHYRRIGNMTLMKADENSVQGNAGFAEKKLAFAVSKFNLTRQISVYGEWDAEAIANRQSELSKLAVQTWPIKS